MIKLKFLTISLLGCLCASQNLFSATTPARNKILLLRHSMAGAFPTLNDALQQLVKTHGITNAQATFINEDQLSNPDEVGAIMYIMCPNTGRLPEDFSKRKVAFFSDEIETFENNHKIKLPQNIRTIALVINAGENAAFCAVDSGITSSMSFYQLHYWSDNLFPIKDAQVIKQITKLIEQIFPPIVQQQTPEPTPTQTPELTPTQTTGTAQNPVPSTPVATNNTKKDQEPSKENPNKSPESNPDKKDKKPTPDKATLSQTQRSILARIFMPPAAPKISGIKLSDALQQHRKAQLTAQLWCLPTAGCAGIISATAGYFIGKKFNKPLLTSCLTGFIGAGATWLGLQCLKPIRQRKSTQHILSQAKKLLGELDPILEKQALEEACGKVPNASCSQKSAQIMSSLVNIINQETSKA